MKARSSKQSASTLSPIWILLWGIVSIVPFIPYSQPLWLASWSDNPYSYLVWVPIFAFVWAGWSIWRDHEGTDDPELSYLVALVVAALCGALLVVGRSRWDLIFVGQNVGLLLWPVWSMSMAWWMFGISATRLLWKPMAYLLLSWPPLYTKIVSLTNPLLDNIANFGVAAMRHAFSWLVVNPTAGSYTVVHNGVHTVVHVTSVCNGADSFLAMVVLLPIIMVSYSRGFWKKAILVLLGAVLAVLGNVIRLWLILLALHWFGGQFALGILHPILGVLLFLVMFAVLVWVGTLIGLRPVGFKRVGVPLQRPHIMSFATSLLSAVVVTVLLWPLLANATGSVSNPKAVKSDVLATLLPVVPSWHKDLVGNYDEASTLGPGAKSTAMAYTTIQGDYALAEMWWTYHPLVLKGYSEQNCLLFHGSKIIATKKLKLNNGIDATVYAVYLPALKVGGNRDVFIDTVYSYSAKYQGKTVYIRMEIASPVLLNVRPTQQLTQSIAQLETKLLDSKYDNTRQIPPVSVNQTVHLHNYLTLIHQLTAELL